MEIIFNLPSDLTAESNVLQYFYLVSSANIQIKML